jgi:ATP-binding cassette subfamily B protein
MRTLKFIIQLISYRKFLYGINLIIWSLAHLSPVFIGLFTKLFFDKLSGESTVELSIDTIIILFLVVSLARILFIILGMVTHVTQSFIFQSLLRISVLNRLFEKPVAEAHHHSNGEVNTSLRDDISQSSFILGQLQIFPGHFLFFIGASIILFHANWQIALASYLPIIVMMVILHYVKYKLVEFRKAYLEATSEVNGFLGSIYDSIQAVLLSCSEKHIVNSFDSLIEKRRRLSLREGLFNSIINSFFSNSSKMVLGLIMLFSALHWGQGFLTVGDLALFVFYSPYVNGFIGLFGDLFIQFKQAGVSINRLLKLSNTDSSASLVIKDHSESMSNRPSTTDTPNEKPSQTLMTLESENLSYYYHGSANGITEINMRLERGSRTVVIGRVGSGKSTLIKLLTGQLKATSGILKWNGTEIVDPVSFFQSPVCAYTAQVTHLITDTLRNNVLLGLPATDDELLKILHRAVMDKEIEWLDNGLDTEIGVGGIKLSGGQAQRTAVARMYARQAELYVIDDVSSALDIETQAQLWNRIFKEDHSTYLIVSYRKEVLLRANNIIVMKEGRIEAEGKLEHLLQSCNEMRLLWQEDVMRPQSEGDL